MSINKHFKKYGVTMDSNLPNDGLSIDVEKVDTLRDTFTVELEEAIDNLVNEKVNDFVWRLGLEMSGVDTSKINWEDVEPFLSKQKWNELMVLFDREDGDNSAYGGIEETYFGKVLESLEYFAQYNVIREAA